mmetsp:Transcript_27018/g.45007  ORF Transcript_27018/g.45007 Transcript_27018/m.45007 type:complete len:131 (-) Transcript_27018:60-452(-)|eukprot:CAMPEP_0119004926 /NCGR_PEP_ID=MMETSP1176-20130426/1435_1 /TAXON_ID=265551 /ORGANISM="Synedropsis recta cf, Strain CCMP1620" /LENGTH=130 /DNA_ID=CAMNT_0006956687 /DNA_START=86 /DNA_END=478 /DNA_ORIENTATION=+
MAFIEDTCVSLAPKFKIKEGKTVADISVHMDKMVSLVKANEPLLCNEYAFTFSADNKTFCCRESYASANGVLAHLENVGAVLGAVLETTADLIEIEVHGPAAELAKLKEPLTHLNPTFFELKTGGIRNKA